MRLQLGNRRAANEPPGFSKQQSDRDYKRGSSPWLRTFLKNVFIWFFGHGGLLSNSMGRQLQKPHHTRTMHNSNKSFPKFVQLAKHYQCQCGAAWTIVDQVEKRMVSAPYRNHLGIVQNSKNLYSINWGVDDCEGCE
jgi:hypothetical protein